MGIGFEKRAVEKHGFNWEEMAKFNDAILNLENQKRKKVTPEDKNLGMAKVAWKISTYQQAMLNRVLMLAKGASEMWNLDNPLCSMLCARA
ncbi:MAG: hypothetical protein IIB57_14470, partial [Planctomycetes bacterium]|nr:hypothetical protein [Planctomycetota bacterium]